MDAHFKNIYCIFKSHVPPESLHDPHLRTTDVDNVYVFAMRFSTSGERINGHRLFLKCTKKVSISVQSHRHHKLSH